MTAPSAPRRGSPGSGCVLTAASVITLGPLALVVGILGVRAPAALAVLPLAPAFACLAIALALCVNVADEVDQKLPGRLQQLLWKYRYPRCRGLLVEVGQLHRELCPSSPLRRIQLVLVGLAVACFLLSGLLLIVAHS